MLHFHSSCVNGATLWVSGECKLKITMLDVSFKFDVNINKKSFSMLWKIAGKQSRVL